MFYVAKKMRQIKVLDSLFQLSTSKAKRTDKTNKIK